MEAAVGEGEEGCGSGGELGKVSYIIIIPLSNGRAASPGEFVLNGRFARRTGQREREERLRVGRKSCLHLHNHINTPSSSSSRSLRGDEEGLGAVCCHRSSFLFS